MVWRNLPPEMQQTLAGFAWAVWWALIGRSLYHADLVRKGRRRFWSLHLAWELMIAVGMGVVAGGAAEYLKLGGMAAAGFIAAVSYLGPRSIESVQAWAERKAGIDDPDA
ncbi:MAG: hypothetical protein A3G18_05385 [Rhodospirillales bacterium RIFCSPLOWO2_12_FULL_58_28]|nr:MAG: hypothetical protein A3H92_04735 [Rhodospirillales bacterium RIFCSPLOWO2_02_FULL_58_16]OHC78201.1 MAG: hypothetical protein A3G18_05385 [Rhodospirillales bacterium RIFCSPLOWO2_12_FULL_58_28]